MTNPLDALPEHAYDEVRAELQRIYAEWKFYPASIERRGSGGSLWDAAEYLAEQKGVTVTLADEERRRTSAAWVAYWTAHAIPDRRFPQYGGWWPTDDPILAGGAPRRPTDGTLPPITATWRQVGDWLSSGGLQLQLLDLSAAA